MDKLVAIATEGAYCYIANLMTGEVIPIRLDDAAAKPEPQGTSRPVVWGGPSKTGGAVIRGGPRSSREKKEIR